MEVTRVAAYSTKNTFVQKIQVKIFKVKIKNKFKIFLKITQQGDINDNKNKNQKVHKERRITKRTKIIRVRAILKIL